VARVAGSAPAVLLLADVSIWCCNYLQTHSGDLQVPKLPYPLSSRLQAGAGPAKARKSVHPRLALPGSVRSRVCWPKRAVSSSYHISTTSPAAEPSRPECQQLVVAVAVAVAVAAVCTLLLAPCPPVGRASEFLAFTSLARRRARS
jgi:hypothetical protein